MIATQKIEAKSGFLSEETTREAWAETGRRIYREAERLTWSLADWAAFGERKFGALKEFCELHGLNYELLRNYAWVSRSVPLSCRHDQLSFSFHQEVAALEEKHQAKWLQIAIDEKLTVPSLRRRIRESTCNSSALQSDGIITRTIGTKYDEVKAFILAQEETFWNEDNKRIWRERLRPIVEFYEAKL